MHVGSFIFEGGGGGGGFLDTNRARYRLISPNLVLVANFDSRSNFGHSNNIICNLDEQLVKRERVIRRWILFRGKYGYGNKHFSDRLDSMFFFQWKIWVWKRKGYNMKKDDELKHLALFIG
ncbi:hypothetical protein ACJX0J_011667 [Zea mays]